MIQIQFETTAADFVAFQRFVASSLQLCNGGRSWILFGVLFGAGLSLGATGYAHSLHWPTAAALACFFGVVWIYARWQLKRASVPSERGAILGPRQVTLDAEGVRDKSANHNAITTWRGVLAIEETPTHVFLMIDRFSAYIVPKRAFENSTRLGEFMTFARKHADA